MNQSNFVSKAMSTSARAGIARLGRQRFALMGLDPLSGSPVIDTGIKGPIVVRGEPADGATVTVVIEGYHCYRTLALQKSEVTS